MIYPDNNDKVHKQGFKLNILIMRSMPHYYYYRWYLIFYDALLICYQLIYTSGLALMSKKDKVTLSLNKKSVS
jgi:hypothetical protein